MRFRHLCVLLAFFAATAVLWADSTVLNDTFTAGANEALTAHTPDTGTSWTLNEQTGTAAFQVVASSDILEASIAENSARVSYYATENPAFSGADVSVQMTLSAVLPSVDGTFYMILRRTAADNYYAALFYNAAVATDAYILKVLAGTVSTIDSGDCAFAATDVAKFSATGTTTTTLTLLKNGSPCGTAVTGTDASSPITDAGRCGFGSGNLRVMTDDVDASGAVDNFSCVDITEAGGGASPFKLLLLGVGE